MESNRQILVAKKSCSIAGFAVLLGGGDQPIARLGRAYRAFDPAFAAAGNEGDGPAIGTVAADQHAVGQGRLLQPIDVITGIIRRFLYRHAGRGLLHRRGGGEWRLAERAGYPLACVDTGFDPQTAGRVNRQPI